ncbi:MAG: hypothetical protein U9N56_07760 [Actinomycetota bacterium]|nr:hypothetical protein [Actinomycetota bacterium]
MKKALVFVAAFALVLVAGAAVAFMATPGDDTAGEPVAIRVPATTTSIVEKEQPPTTQAVKEEPIKDDHSGDLDDEPKDEPEEEVEEKDTTPPDIVILFPEDGQHFDEKKVAFEGKTEPGARVFAGDYEADVDGEGNWRIVLILTHDGGNLAAFDAVDEAGNKSTASVKAYYDAPDEPKEEPKEEPKDYEFSATQKYGSCGEEVPYDKWYGMGDPGTKIWIESKFGSGSTVIGESGEWWLKVEFPEAPCGETFDVVLETDQGHREVYSFTRICEEKTHDEGAGDK